MRQSMTIPGDKSWRAKLILVATYLVLIGMVMILGTLAYSFYNGGRGLTLPFPIFFAFWSIIVASTLLRGLVSAPLIENPYFDYEFPLSDKPSEYHIRKAKRLWSWAFPLACLAAVCSLLTAISMDSFRWAHMPMIFGMLPLTYYVTQFNKRTFHLPPGPRAHTEADIPR